MVYSIFSTEGKGWPEFPRTSYGRLDQMEPPVPAGTTEVMFAFDAVNANWSAFGPSAQFDLSDANKIDAKQRLFWDGLFRKRGSSRSPDPYGSAPIYRIEITSRPGDPYFDDLIQIKETDWVKIELADVGKFGVDVYGGLFADPVPAYLLSITIETTRTSALTAAFDMVTWPDATEAEIKSALSGLPYLDYLIAYDIGQGSANGLADGTETTQLYFDLGCGVYGNRTTRPIPLRFCWKARRPAGPPIILSHWDSDHWAGETADPAAAKRTWIAPRQTIGPTHTAFAARVLSAGGTVHIWGASPSSLTIPLTSGQHLDLARCSGSGRNGSGISCVVKDTAATQGWLLTGDAGYHELNQTSLPSDLRAVVVPHHGADMGPSSTPPRSPTGYARLLYSFGPGNKHGWTHVQHPTSSSVKAHTACGWNHNHWVAATPATCVAGGDILATAHHPGTHLNGAVAGWIAPPTVPFTTIPCAGDPPRPSGCTGKITQA